MKEDFPNIPYSKITKNLKLFYIFLLFYLFIKFICSSIVGGIPSIAAGIAFAIKLQNKNNHVWCWVGDMSAETGAFHEAYKYSLNHNLPITFIVEDNKKSVCTPTPDVWKRTTEHLRHSRCACPDGRQDRRVLEAEFGHH
jgi:hypothetical protein